MDPTLIAWIAAVVLVIVIARATMLGRVRKTRGVADSWRNATDVGPEVLAADSTIHHHKHAPHHGAHDHDSASTGHTSHVGHDAGGHTGFEGGHSGFDGGHGGFDGGGFDGGSH